MDYLLDTNHVSKLLEGNESIASKVNAMKNSGSRFSISTSILGELFFAVFAGSRREENLLKLREFIGDIILWNFDATTAEEFGKVQAEQKAKGKPVPSVDAQIAAVARVNGLTVLTADQHFSFINNLSVENWL